MPPPPPHGNSLSRKVVASSTHVAFALGLRPVRYTVNDKPSATRSPSRYTSHLTNWVRHECPSPFCSVDVNSDPCGSRYRSAETVFLRTRLSLFTDTAGADEGFRSFAFGLRPPVSRKEDVCDLFRRRFFRHLPFFGFFPASTRSLSTSRPFATASWTCFRKRG